MKLYNIRCGIPLVRTPLLFIVILVFNAGCSTGFYDGMRVNGTGSNINLNGYITQPGNSGAEVRVSAYNVLTNVWDLIAHTSNGGTISNSPFTMADGTLLYYWNIGQTTLAAQYWAVGTGGHYARVKAEWYNSLGSLVAQLLNPRADWLTCFFEDRNGQANTLNYLLSNCFSHRSEAYIYAGNYREGVALCPAPALALAKTHNHYMLTQIPSCALTIIYNRMAERINSALIDDHYEIEHHQANNAHLVNAVGGNSLGGFFGGHENYLRKMERHVMVYDYPWMARGKIPSWSPNTTVPAVFRNAVAAPGGNCSSQEPACNGWLSDPITDWTPGIATPVAVLPANVCGFPTTAALHGVVNPWHGGVHGALGGAFTSFDSPSFPLFFLWHNYVQDVWLDWKSCGLAGP